jgi:hypothetical protein
MKTKSFNEVVERRLENIKNTLVSKGQEYADNINDDKLHNFKKGERFTGKKREDVLLGFAMKHWISVTDILDKMDTGELPTRELLDEKLGDWQVYMVLLEASIVDKINKQNLPF